MKRELKLINSLIIIYDWAKVGFSPNIFSKVVNASVNSKAAALSSKEALEIEAKSPDFSACLLTACRKRSVSVSLLVANKVDLVKAICL